MRARTIRHIFFSLLILTPFAVWANDDVTDGGTVTVDSLSEAYGVIIADFLRADLHVDSIQMVDFVKGVNDAVNSENSSQYYYGIINGKATVDRVASMIAMGLPLDEKSVLDKVVAVLSGNETSIDNEAANGIINAFIAENFSNETSSVTPESQQAFLDSVAQLPDAKITETGVVMIPVKTATGASPRVGDKVLVSYSGSLYDGTVFDSTDEPIEMIVGSLVPGFNEALLNMTEGSTWRAVIPSSVAYGEEGIEGVIPGNALLDFIITIEHILN